MLEKNLKLLNINLKLFDEGGAAAGAATGSTGAAPAGNTTAGGQQSTSAKPVVVYGKQETAATEVKPDPNTQGSKKETQGTTPTPEERKAAYAKFKNDNKDLYNEDVQGHIRSRLKGYKGLETQFAQVTPLVEYLSEIYGTTDIPTLMSKVQGETLAQLAEKEGMTVEQYKKVVDLKAENRRLQNQNQTADVEKETNAKVGKWYDEVNKIVGTKDAPGQYPDFNFKEWAQNDEFLSVLESLTRSGFNTPVQKAYEVCNIDGIKKSTAQKAEDNTVKNIQARGSRPPENGTKASPGMLIKNDVSKLSREDRAEIARRAARGEEIKF